MKARLTRKQAIIVKAIPKQFLLMLQRHNDPRWEMFSSTEAWKQTVENLKLTKKEQEWYRDAWNSFLNYQVEQVTQQIKH